ncbi:MAG TPA: aminopeptidase [Steroidobacteraceae bacterium]|nr:aminopeptidase [Steroidobacteraceae bacterium]
MVRMLTESSPGSVANPGVAAQLVCGVRALLLAAACTLLSGCGTLYLMQAASGQWQVLRQRVPIDRLLADPRTPPALRAHLQEVRAAREFASHELGLPDNRSYRSYADIGRPYVVWNVVAAPEFSVSPKRWCFPIAGCVAYRGYFREQRAREFAAALAVRGFDVTVDGVPAYSTLGRLADPVLSSMLRYGDDELAATIFHELAHQLLYVRDDSEFNEAFATTVEAAGLERWLAHQGASERLQQFRERQAHTAAFLSLLAQSRARLALLYASGVARDEMRAGKAQILAALAADIRTLELREGVSYPLYEEWIAAGLNNARLASVSTYFDCVPGFTRLLTQAGNDLTRFYTAARELARQPRALRHARLCTAAAGQTG